MELTPKLRALFARLELRRPGSDCLYVFPNRSGVAYTASGFKGMFGKLLTEVMNEKLITKRFTFHDLRAYYVTQHKQERGTLPDLHANPQTTARVYDRSKTVKQEGL